MTLIPKKNNFFEDYKDGNRLGIGLNGEVRSCTHKKSGKTYAFKVLKDKPETRREIDLQWRACQECQYIVKIVDVYENHVNSKLRFIVVMECMEGGELYNRIASRNTPFTEREAAQMMFQISSAVKHLHSMKIAHRDLKPENLLLTTTSNNAIIKLSDFGFAKELSDGLTTPCYTPYYVAPEVLQNENRSLFSRRKEYDLSCDIWSLGVICYILLSGRPPFYANTNGGGVTPGMRNRIRTAEFRFDPENIWLNVSNQAKELITSMLQAEPENRIKIGAIMENSWISNNLTVPTTPLSTIRVMNEEPEQIANTNMATNDLIDENRNKYEIKKPLKNVKDANNPMLKAREQQKQTAPIVTPESSTIIDEDETISKEDNKNEK